MLRVRLARLSVGLLGGLTMRTPDLGRALFASSGVYAVTYTAVAIVIDAWYGRTLRITSLLEYVLLSTLVVATVGFFVQLPIVRALRSFNRAAAVSAGALLAPVPFAALVMLLRDSDDSASPEQYLQFWLRVPGEFLVPFASMALAGGVLAWFATARRRATA